MTNRKRIRAFEELPEGCIATILSRTTPVDVGRLSIVSKTFRSAADSDTVWNCFLTPNPQFIDSIISQYPSLSNSPNKKALYMALSDRPIIINHGRKSFQFHRKSGQKCYLLAARSLTIDCRNVKAKKEWIHMHDSRFPEVAKLCLWSSHEVRGIINTLSLSPNTEYAAYLVFKIIYAHGYENEPMNFSVGFDGGQRSIKSVCLDPNSKHSLHNIEAELQRPSVRSDGWLEIEMGEFFISSLKDQEIHMCVIQRTSSWLRGNLFIEGIEVRSK